MSSKYNIGLAVAVVLSVALIQSGILFTNKLSVYSQFQEWKN